MTQFLSKLIQKSQARRLVLVGLFLSIFTGMQACSSSGSSPGNIIEVATENGNFTILLSSLEQTGLEEALEGDGPFTVFAPTDDAFNLLPLGLLESLDNATLTAILQYHVVSGQALSASEITNLTEVTTLGGVVLPIQVDNGVVVLDGRVQVTITDVEASNGIIHVVDAVLIPGAFPGTIVDALVASPRFSTLVEAVVATSLVETLSGDNGGAGFTVFAPTNNAFSQVEIPTDLGVLTNLILYHGLPSSVDAATAIGIAQIAPPGNLVETLLGGITGFVTLTFDGTTLFVNDVPVTFTDIETSNGFIHVLSGVLSIPVI